MRPNRPSPNRPSFLLAAAALAPLLLVAACGKSQDASGPPEPPADAPAEAPAANAANVAAPAPATDFSRPINALGTEPFWALKIRPEGLVLSEPDKADRTLKNPGPAIKGSTAVWAAEGLQLGIAAGVCQDGMSDRSYPFTAELKMDGKTRKGCATYADQALP